MEEKIENIPENKSDITDAPVVPVKFNKEIRNLSIEEAANLSQKGLKYESIFPQWEKVRLLSKQENMSTAEFLDALEKERTKIREEELTRQCGGNSEMAKRIIELEGNTGNFIRGEKDFKEFFPNKSIESLPEEILDRVKENNSNLLDEYLRYKAKQALLLRAEEKKRRENLLSSVGSQKDSGISRSEDFREFVRGIWNN